ncbi:MAG: stage III sporulation protein AE, partial [Clostridia bacterium]
KDSQYFAKDACSAMSNTFELDKYAGVIDEYAKKSGIDDISFTDITNDLITKNETDYSSIIVKVLSFFAKEIVGAIKGAISIFIIVIIMAIISSLELDKKSDITQIAHLVCFLALATITVATFIDTITMFKNVVSSLTGIMQVISPFLMAVLIATGAISSTGIIQPMLLFIASAIGGIVTYIILPFLSISVAINVICSISKNLKLEKMSKLFSSSAIWIMGIVLTVFLGILSLETSLTSSIDSLGIKATQTAVSNFVPVVGKFFSDSFETVVGATKVVGRVGGSIGIISLIIVALVPVIKIASIAGVYMILAALIEPISSDESTAKYITGFISIYKTLLGILIGITILFVISTGIILNLASSVIT